MMTSFVSPPTSNVADTSTSSKSLSGPSSGASTADGSAFSLVGAAVAGKAVLSVVGAAVAGSGKAVLSTDVDSSVLVGVTIGSEVLPQAINRNTAVRVSAKVRKGR